MRLLCRDVVSLFDRPLVRLGSPIPRLLRRPFLRALRLKRLLPGLLLCPLGSLDPVVLRPNPLPIRLLPFHPRPMLLRSALLLQPSSSIVLLPLMPLRQLLPSLLRTLLPRLLCLSLPLRFLPLVSLRLAVLGASLALLALPFGVLLLSGTLRLDLLPLLLLLLRLVVVLLLLVRRVRVRLIVALFLLLGAPLLALLVTTSSVIVGVSWKSVDVLVESLLANPLALELGLKSGYVLRVLVSGLLSGGGLVVLVTRGVVGMGAEVASVLLLMMSELLLEGVVLALRRGGEIVSGGGVCEGKSA